MPEIFVQNQEQLDGLFEFLDKARGKDYKVIRRDHPLEGKRGLLAFFTNALGEEILCEATYQYAEPISVKFDVDPERAESTMVNCLAKEMTRFHDARKRITGFVDHEESKAYIFNEEALDALSDPTREKWIGRKESRTYEFASYLGMKALFEKCPELERMLVEDQITVEEVVGYLRKNLTEHVFLKQHPGSCIR
jgi:hypothetical protein